MILISYNEINLNMDNSNFFDLLIIFKLNKFKKNKICLNENQIFWLLSYY